MADTKLSALTTALAALADLVYIVDVSDTTDDPAGSSRGTTLQSVLDTLGVPYSPNYHSLVPGTGASNERLGTGALAANTTGTSNLALGPAALAVNAGGSQNVGIGYQALLSNVSGSNNMGIGLNALVFCTASGNTAVGTGALQATTGGTNNVGIGLQSGLTTLTTGGNNVLLGAATDTAAPGTSGGIALGYGAVCADNECAFGNSLASLNLASAVWPRNHPGRKRTATAPTNATNTLSSGLLSDLSVTLATGKKYTGRVVFIAKNSTGAEGLQFDFNGGTATMTNFQATLEATPIGATVGVANSVALATALTNTAVATTDAVFAYALTMVANAGGTFIPRFAENSAHTSGTATVEIGSYLWLEDTA